MSTGIAREDIERHPQLADFVDKRMEECPFVGYPTGWFLVAFSDEIKAGQLTPAHYFGKDLVIWRSDAGEIRVMDAHCPHMGGHLAHGAVGAKHEFGLVVGDSLQCPWHGWRWSGEGRNVEIPNSSKCNQNARVKVWPTREIQGRLVMVWHDSEGREPFWEVPGVPELDEPEEYYLEEGDTCRAFYENLFFPIPMLAENYVDGAHIKFVHGSEIGDPRVTLDEGPVFKSFFDVVYRSRRSGHATEGSITVEGWGQGVTINRLYGVHDNFMIVGHTPTDGWHSDIRVLNFCRRVPGEPHPSGLAKLTIEKQLTAINEDQPIVEHARYRARPAFTAEEAKVFMSVRRWTRQFYPLLRGPARAPVRKTQI